MWTSLGKAVWVPNGSMDYQISPREREGDLRSSVKQCCAFAYVCQCNNMSLWLLEALLFSLYLLFPLLSFLALFKALAPGSYTEERQELHITG